MPGYRRNIYDSVAKVPDELHGRFHRLVLDFRHSFFRPFGLIRKDV